MWSRQSQCNIHDQNFVCMALHLVLHCNHSRSSRKCVALALPEAAYNQNLLRTILHFLKLHPSDLKSPPCWLACIVWEGAIEPVLQENCYQQSQMAVSSLCYNTDLTGKTCNSGMTVMRATNYFPIRWETCFREGIHTWSCELGQKLGRS